MWQRLAFVATVVLLGFSGGVLALFVRGMHAERGAMAGFCFVSALAIVQVGWLPLPSPRSAGYPAIFEMHVSRSSSEVSLVGLCAIVGGPSHGIHGGQLGSTRPIRHC